MSGERYAIVPLLACSFDGLADGDFHDFQMVRLVEQASMIVNNRWVSGQVEGILARLASRGNIIDDWTGGV